MKCEDCIFWNEIRIDPAIAAQQETKRWGDCRRHSPSLVLSGNREVGIRYESNWAVTKSDDWCGEFEKKDK